MIRSYNIIQAKFGLFWRKHCVHSCSGGHGGPQGGNHVRGIGGEPSRLMNVALSSFSEIR